MDGGVQALNVGFLLAHGLLAFQILAVETRGWQQQFQALLAIEFALVGCAAWTMVVWLAGATARRDHGTFFAS